MPRKLDQRIGSLREKKGELERKIADSAASWTRGAKTS